jgi:hypothetical protein
MQYLYYSILFACLFIYLGLGLSLLVSPKELRKHALFLSPMVGYCYLTLVGWYCYNLELGGTDSYARFIALPPAVFLCLALLNRKREQACDERPFHGESIAPLAVACIGFLVVSMPFFKSVDGLTSLSAGNNDIAHSAGVSRYLKEFTRSDSAGFLGQSPDYKIATDRGGRFGSRLSIAFASSLFSLEPYQLQSLSLQVFFFFSILLVYSLARESFRYNRLGAIGITALYSANPLMYLTIYHGYQGQIMGIGLALCILLLNIQAINTCQTRADYMRYIPLAVLFTWGLSTTYSHMLLFIYAPIAIYLAVMSFQRGPRPPIIPWALFTVLTLVILCVLSPTKAKVLAFALYGLGRSSSGWFIPWMSPDTVFGLSTMENLGLQSHTGLMRYILSIPPIIILIFGLRRAYKDDRNVFILAGSSIFIMVIGYTVLAFVGRVEDTWGGYKSYKLLSFFLPLVLMASLILFRNIEFTARGQIRNVLPLLLGVLIGCNIFSGYNVSAQMSNTRRLVSKDLADLKRIENLPSVQSVNILGKDWWDILWQVHFLMRKKLYLETHTGVGYPAGALVGQWDLKRVRDTSNDILRLVGFDEVETIVVNSTYLLEKAGEARTLKARLGKGWHDSEVTHRWTGNGSDTSTVILQSAADGLAIDLRTRYFPLDPNNRLSIYLNGKKIVDCSDNYSCLMKSVHLSTGRNVLEFRAVIPPAPPGTADKRHLGYRFTAIEISPANANSRGRTLPKQRFSSNSCLNCPDWISRNL